MAWIAHGSKNNTKVMNLPRLEPLVPLRLGPLLASLEAHRYCPQTNCFGLEVSGRHIVCFGSGECHSRQLCGFVAGVTGVLIQGFGPQGYSGG